jgi:hypothetical protein
MAMSQNFVGFKALRLRYILSSSNAKNHNSTAIAPPSKIQRNPGSPHKLRFETTILYTLTDRQSFLSSIRNQ